MGDVLNTSTFDNFKYVLKGLYLIIPNDLNKEKFSMFREQVDVMECSNYKNYLNLSKEEKINFEPKFSGFVHFNSSIKQFCFSRFVIESIDNFKEELYDYENENEEQFKNLIDLFDFIIENFYNYFSVSSHDNTNYYKTYGNYQRGNFNENEVNEKIYVKNYSVINNVKIPTVIRFVTTKKVLKTLGGNYEIIKDVTNCNRYLPVIFKGTALKTFLIKQEGEYLVSNDYTDYPVKIKLYKQNYKNEQIREFENKCSHIYLGSSRNFLDQLTNQFCRMDGSVSV